MSELLRVTDLTKRFPISKDAFVGAVNGISFELGAGETLGLVGESGSGKTTTGRCILRIIEPTSGSIIFDGVDITTQGDEALRRMRSKMQLVFQEPLASLNPRRTVSATLEEPLVLEGELSKRERRERVLETLKLVGLDSTSLGLYPAQLTSSEAQRIGVGRALVTRPKLVVLDEPTSALDSTVRAALLDVLQGIQAELGTSFLFISHDLTAVRRISHRVAIMYLGRLVEIAPTEELFAQQSHPYSRALLSAVLPVDPRAPLDPFVVEGEIPSAVNPKDECPFYSRCPLRTEECLEHFPGYVDVGENHRTACIHSSDLASKSNTELAAGRANRSAGLGVLGGA
ncbi:oligopeptide/dipeptide ABC transporter ATP-binding protein [Gemmatimonas sp.]|uniref:oligopeptide/dipeptide ABC transporter ATP-binding protein n=1 Tax=Gemmatimonas sp. TaxID=1962908 RepID=UPI003561BE36